MFGKFEIPVRLCSENQRERERGKGNKEMGSVVLKVETFCLYWPELNCNLINKKRAVNFLGSCLIELTVYVRSIRQQPNGGNFVFSYWYTI